VTAVLRLDGEVAPNRRLLVSTDAPLVTSGDAWFETVRVDAGRALRLALHVDRLVEAATLAGHPCLDRRYVHDHLATAVADIDAPVGRVRGTFMVDEEGRPRCWTDAAAWTPPSESAYAAGVQLRVVDVPHAPSGRWGKTVSRQWARTAMRLAHPAEPVVLSVTGHVVESGRAAVIWRIGDVWYLPSRELGALASTTVRALERTGLTFVEAHAVPEALGGADAVVLVSSLRLAMGVRSLGLRTWDSPDESARLLRERLQRGMP
jgi:branched-subunit amino acid aminotransferase/4-amino-4-deoxychorismate lyase